LSEFLASIQLYNLNLAIMNLIQDLHKLKLIISDFQFSVLYYD
jgi:hypothetical protein